MSPLVLCLMFCCFKTGLAQTAAPNGMSAPADVEDYRFWGEHESAQAVLDSMLHEMQAKGTLDSPAGLQLQLKEATALELFRPDLALDKMLHIAQKSKENATWAVYAEACLSVSMLFETFDHLETSKEWLDASLLAIRTHGLDSIGPRFAARASSWHRFNGSRDSAIFYASQAIREARRFGQKKHGADGHFLMSVLLPSSAIEARILHCDSSLQLHRQTGDDGGVAYQLGAMSKLYLEKMDYPKALTYNDSCTYHLISTYQKGPIMDRSLAIFYHLRSNIYASAGNKDSALVYMGRAFEKSQTSINDKTANTISGLENELTRRKMQEQALVLRLKNNQLMFSLLAIVLVLILAIGLSIGYRRQRKIKEALAVQNALIHAQSEQLKSLDEAKSRFFANVSHELRTPLTLLTSPIKTLLKENQLTEKQTQLLQMADRSGKQLGQLINEILDLRKLEMGKMTLTPEPTEVRAYFQTYFAQFESLAGQKKIDYQVAVDVPDKAIVDLDREKCRQILFNLLSNAFKFTPEGGRISAVAAIKEGRLELTVADSGPGIHPDDLPYIFDRYFQTNRPDKPVEGGTGIGLALCREYAQLFGGSIQAASTPGADTVFRVTFPLHYAEVKAEDVAIPEDNASLASRSDAEITSFASLTTPQSADNKPTVLVVEDNPDLRAYISMVLQDKYRVITADHGQEALAMINDECSMMNGNKGGANSSSIIHHSSLPDLILSDLMMPVMDGYQLLERLKSDDATRHIPVVMLTARAEAQDKLKALRIGVDDYLTKPFDEEELLVRIENLLKNQAARRTAFTDETETKAAPLMSQPDREWLETFEGYVQQHFSSDLLSVSSLAHEFSMSESTLLRQLKRLTGLSPIQYIQEVRLNEARRLLENRAYNSIAQVASKVGYEDTRSFSRSFRQRFGKLPSVMQGA